MLFVVRFEAKPAGEAEPLCQNGSTRASVNAPRTVRAVAIERPNCPLRQLALIMYCARIPGTTADRMSGIRRWSSEIKETHIWSKLLTSDHLLGLQLTLVIHDLSG